MNLDYFAEQILNNKDIADSCYINGEKVRCVVNSAFNSNSAFTAFGYDSGVNFTLSIKNDNKYQPKKGDIIKFKNKEYKIDDFLLDAYETFWDISLKVLTSK